MDIKEAIERTRGLIDEHYDWLDDPERLLDIEALAVLRGVVDRAHDGGNVGQGTKDTMAGCDQRQVAGCPRPLDAAHSGGCGSTPRAGLPSPDDERALERSAPRAVTSGDLLSVYFDGSVRFLEPKNTLTAALSCGLFHMEWRGNNAISLTITDNEVRPKVPRAAFEKIISSVYGSGMGYPHAIPSNMAAMDWAEQQFRKLGVFVADDNLELARLSATPAKARVTRAQIEALSSSCSMESQVPCRRHIRKWLRSIGVEVTDD